MESQKINRITQEDKNKKKVSKASAFVDTREYVAQISEPTQNIHQLNDHGLSTSSSDVSKYFVSGPYGRMSYQGNKQTLYNNENRFVPNLETSGNRFLDYRDYSYGSPTDLRHYGVNRIGYLGDQSATENGHAVNHGSDIGASHSHHPQIECPDESGLSSGLLIIVALGSLVGIYSLYDKTVLGRKRRSLGILQLFMAGCTIYSFSFSHCTFPHLS